MDPAGKMLIVDYALSWPAIVEGIAYYFARCGCAVHYRPFYPNLVRADLEEYAVIALLAGRTPAFPSGRMGLAEVEAAVEFVTAGGRLLLGPNLDGGEGGTERRLFNRLLRELGIAITIEDVQVVDPENGYMGSLDRRPFYQPVAGHPTAAGVAARLVLDRATPLRVGAGADVLLTTFATARPHGRMPVIAAGRAGAGLVLVAGRHLLNATGLPQRISAEPLLEPDWLEATVPFLQAVARYVIDYRPAAPWRPCQPGPVGAVAEPGADAAPGGPEPARDASEEADAARARPALLDRAPAGCRTVVLEPPAGTPFDFDRGLAAAYERLPDERRYGWIRREGIRACWGSTVDWGEACRTQEEVARIGRALAGCGVNLFWGISNCQAVARAGYTAAEREQVLTRWRWTAAALAGTGVKWYPTLDYRYFRDERSRCVGAQGQVLAAPSPLDLEFWRQSWREPLLAIAEFSRECPCIGGVAIDMELYAHPPAYNYYMGYGFEDACFEFALERLASAAGGGLLAAGRGLPLAERYDWLRVNGLLAGYFGVLSAEVERICREIAAAIWEVNPDLLIASYIFTTPCNWFDLGVYRGFSSPARPLLLMTFNLRSGRLLEHLRRARVFAFHAMVAMLGQIAPGEHETVFAHAFRLGHGYWLNNINALVDATPNSCESPACQGLEPAAAIAAIGAASRRTGPGRPAPGAGPRAAG